MGDEFVILPMSGLWVVTCAEIIVARCVTRPEAIRAAILAASRYASYGKPVQVLLEEPAGRTIVWDSSRDGLATGLERAAAFVFWSVGHWHLVDQGKRLVGLG